MMSGKNKKFTPYDLFQKEKPSKKTIETALDSTPLQPSVKKAVFPSLEENYQQEKITKKNAARFGLLPLDEDFGKPQKLNIEKNIVTDHQPVKINQKPSSRLLQEESIDSFLKMKEKGNGYRKVAKFLLLLGMDQSAKILRLLPSDDVEKITAEIATIHTISKEESEEILSFYETSKKELALPQGGIEVAKEFLIKTYGEKEGLEKFNKTIPVDLHHEAFDFLNDAEGWQLYEVLKDESPLVIASIVPFLKPEQSSNLLRELPASYQVEITKRVAKMQHLDREAMLNLEFGLREKLRRLGKTKDHLTDGSTTLANILRYMDQENENIILESLEEQSERLSKEVREKLFTVEMILNILDSDLQKVLTEYSDNELATFLKGKTPEIEKKVLSNVSKNRAEMIAQEKEFLGAMKKSEVEEVTRKLLHHLRKLQLFGEITVKMEGEEWLE